MNVFSAFADFIKATTPKEETPPAPDPKKTKPVEDELNDETPDENTQETENDNESEDN